LRYLSPEEIGAEEGDGPAVGVLGVHRPLYAQVVNEPEPEPGKREEIEDERWQMEDGARRLALPSAISSGRRRRTG
jgi:hypothetical protein